VSVVIPALPLRLRAFAGLIRQDQGRALGRAVLFASVVGFDVVEQRKADLAAASGVPEARLQQVVDTGRQALSTASPKRPEQHLVSQALLRRFCIPTPKGDRLLSYNLQFGKTKLLPPKQVGKLRDFVKIDSDETERLWGLTEQELPAAIDAVRTRRILKNPKHVAVIKDAIALHYARSLDTLESADRIWQQGLGDARAAYMADRPAMEELFYQKHGFWAGGSTVAEEIADDLLETARSLYDSGAAFRLRVVDLFEEARRKAAAASLEIFRPRRGQFLLGDVPAITVGPGGQALGIPGGVPFGDAKTVILPLTPTRLAALGPADKFEIAPAAGRGDGMLPVGAYIGISPMTCGAGPLRAPAFQCSPSASRRSTVRTPEPEVRIARSQASRGRRRPRCVNGARGETSGRREKTEES
jgi:Protein of unknown function (DUF4238)